MKPIFAVLYGVGVFLVGLLAALVLMLIFAELFEFNEQLDNLFERIKKLFRR